MLCTNLSQHLIAALTLSERSAYAESSNTRGLGPRDSNRRAAEVLAQWKARAPFAHGDNFERRLRQDGLTLEGLLRVLASSRETYKTLVANPPAWIRNLEELYSTDVPQDDSGSQNCSRALDSFAHVAAPLIRDARLRLSKLAEVLPAKGPIDPDSVERLLLPNLFASLRRSLAGVMLLELNVARVRGTLKGNSPEARFRYFCETLRDPELRRSLLREYPVLFRALHTKANCWVKHVIELLSRLQKDCGPISQEFSPGPGLGTVTSVATGLGDEHRGGKSVATIQFSSGLKLVYKPRSLAVDLHYYELLEWLQEAGFDLPLHLPKIVDRGAYGWSEFVEHTPCSRRQEIERYYRRLGGYLAVFYALRAADMHFENIIAHGEYPVPVDLETLFHPDVDDLDDPAVKVAQSSVMRVLLLPTAIGSKTMEPIDVSALAARDDQLHPAGTFGVLEAEGTDEMHLVYDRPTPMGASQSRPKLLEESVAVQEFLPDFEKGFEQVYRLLEVHREQLLAAGGLLDRFADDQVRFVARPTRLYAVLLDRSYHPDRLKDAIERDQLFDSLWRNVADLPVYTRFIRAERADLHKGDVPVFGSRPRSRDLWSSQGECLPEIFGQSALERVREGLARLGCEDLSRQTQFIRLSINAAGKRSPVSSRLPTPTFSGNHDPLDLALAAGDSLCGQVYESDRYANWIGLRLVGSREAAWSLEPLALDFYEGLAGVAFFLGYLGALTGKGRYSELARKSIDLVRRRLERRRGTGLPMSSVGAFTGEGGTIYALTHLGVLWQDRALLNEASVLAFDLESLIETDSMLDVMSGSAGFIAVLRALDSSSPDDRLLPIAIRCGEKLLREQKPQANGSAWMTKIESSAPLTGFSHGAAGIAWALLRLAEWSGEKRFRLSAESAIRYERGTFVAGQSNWPDYRTGVENSGFSLAWCHGAPGIALARLDSPLITDREAREEIRIALTKTASFPFGHDHCLCHGDLGNLDILLTAAQRTDRCWWDEYGERLFQQTLASIVEDGTLREKQCSLDPLGLMTGLAGFGYGLLRLADPEKVPSILSLQEPRASKHPF